MEIEITAAAADLTRRRGGELALDFIRPLG